MPSWKHLLAEIQGVQSTGTAQDQVRRKYLAELSELTGRNTIVYYSAWLDKGHLASQYHQPFSVNDSDKNAFMTAIHGMDRDKGLDLFLHTPGGDVAAAESLVRYLRAMFDLDIRAIVPQLAMSAGTMIACACKEIVMGLHSSIGPIDPQFRGMPAHGIVEEFNRAKTEIAADPASIPVWQPIISKYHPTLIGESEKAIAWSQQIVEEWLATGMFESLGKPGAEAKAKQVVQSLGDPQFTYSHSRHIDFDAAKQMGLKVVAMEDDDKLQNALLTVHHACMLTLSGTSAVKLVENQDGDAIVQAVEPI